MLDKISIGISFPKEIVSKIDTSTVPMFIVKQWKLKPGDTLDWSLDARRKNEIVIVVKKSAPKKK